MYQPSEKQIIIIILLLVARKRYLIDGIGVAARLFLGIFPCEVKDIIFVWSGHARWTRDENCYAK